MASPEDQRIDRALERFATLPKRTSELRRVGILLAVLVLTAGVAFLVSHVTWRDNLPRSAIAVGWLAIVVLAALWLFGSRGSKAVLGTLGGIGAISSLRAPRSTSAPC